MCMADERWFQDHWFRGEAGFIPAFIDIELGRADSVREILEYTRLVFEDWENDRDVALANFGLAQVMWLDGDRDGALALLDPVESAWEEIGNTPAKRATVRWLRAEWLAEVGRADEACAQLRGAEELLQQARGNGPDRYWVWEPVEQRLTEVRVRIAETG